MTTQDPDLNRFRTKLLDLRDQQGFRGADEILHQLDKRMAGDSAPLFPPAPPSPCREPLYTGEAVELVPRIVGVGSIICALATVALLLWAHFIH